MRITNWLLAGLLVALLLDIGMRLSERPAIAETFRLDGCITDKPNDKPAGYLHVVTHSYAGR